MRVTMEMNEWSVGHVRRSFKRGGGIPLLLHKRRLRTDGDFTYTRRESQRNVLARLQSSHLRDSPPPCKPLISWWSVCSLRDFSLPKQVPLGAFAFVEGSQVAHIIRAGFSPTHAG